MKEKIQITIDNLDDIQSVLRSIELLFQKLIYYYGDNDVKKLYTLVLSCSVWFGKVLRILGYTEEDFKEM
jgi:hypothetical protein